jgi:hypothetical protein
MVAIVHVPSGRQQAPRHLLGAHTPPGAAIMPAGQTEPASTTHEPSSRQHATPGHGFGLQEVAGT